MQRFTVEHDFSGWALRDNKPLSGETYEEIVSADNADLPTMKQILFDIIEQVETEAIPMAVQALIDADILKVEVTS